MNPLHIRALGARAPLVFGLCLLGLSISNAWSQTAPAPAAVATPAAIAVKVQRLDAVGVQPEREAAASVLASNVSRLSAETGGTLLRWSADVGAQVRRGDTLAQIDPRDAELAVQRAQAALDASLARLSLAQAQLKRSQELVAQGFYSQEALLQRQTEVALMQADTQAQRAQLNTAQRQLSKTTLRAPFDGTVQERLAQAGETVAAGSVLFVLVQSGVPEVQAAIDPSDVAGLRGSPRIQLITPQSTHALRLLRINATVSAPARTQTARLAFAGEAAPASAGTSGTLRWQDARMHLPSQVLVKRQGQIGVFVQDSASGKAKARFVPVPGAQEGRPSLVPAGLNAATPVIVQGQAALQDQSPITLR